LYAADDDNENLAWT